MDARLPWPFPIRNAFTMSLMTLLVWHWSWHCYQLTSPCCIWAHGLGRQSCLSISPAQCTLPSSLLPPSLFQPQQPHISHSFTAAHVSGISDLPYALLSFPNWLRNTQMQVRRLNITNQRNTLNWEHQEMYSRNWSESKTNCHTNTESAVNLTAALCVPGITTFPSCERCSLTCLVLEWGITWASIQKLFLWGKCSFITHRAMLLPCCGVHSTDIRKII